MRLLTPAITCTAGFLAAFALYADTGVPDRATRARIDNSYGKLPLRFEANQGQQPAPVKFLSRGKDYTVFLTPDGATLSLRKFAPEPVQKTFDPAAKAPKLEAAADLRLKLEGSNPDVKLSGAGPLPGEVNYLIGNNPAKWRINVTTYERVRYAQVYPGVDLVFYGNQRQLEYDFVVSPGASPDAIRLAVEGADKTFVDPESGDLVLRAAGQEVRFHKPVVYQLKADGSAQEIDGSFRVSEDHVTFEVAAYDHSRELVVDPVLAYSTFLGGSNEDWAYAVAVDQHGNAYIAGYTCSSNFPTTAGSYDPTQPTHAQNTSCDTSLNQTGSDVFVAKLNAAGTALVYSTYLGGTSADLPRGIAVDSAGDAVVVGATVSANFPVTDGSVCAPILANIGNCNFQIESTCQGGQQQNSSNFGTFVTKLNPSGSALLWSTFMGGTGNDNPSGVALDSSGNIYIAANASDSPGQDIFCPGNPEVNFVWPTTPSGYQPDYPSNGYQSSFHPVFTKLSPDGALVYSTYFGVEHSSSTSGNWDIFTSIAVDSSGKAYLGGYTNIPNVPGASNGCAACTNNGQYDGTVAAFDPSQNGSASLIYSTYLGGNAVGSAGGSCGGDEVYSVAVDSKSNAYVTGSACSADFPTTHGAFQSIDPQPGNCNSSNASAFLSKFSSTGALDYSTFLGGSTCQKYSTGYGVSVNSAGEAFVTGFTTDGAFPVLNPIFPSSQYGNSVFVSELNARGSALLFSTLLGACYGCSGDLGYGIHADNYGNVYVVGQAWNSSALPTTTGAFQTAYGGGADDGFALRISLTQADLAVTNSAPATIHRGTHLTYTIAVTNNGPVTASQVSLTGSLPTGTNFVSATTTAGSCKTPKAGAKKGTVTCTVPSLPNAASFTVSMTVDVTARSGAMLTDTATVSSLVFDTNTANNSATATTTVK